LLLSLQLLSAIKPASRPKERRTMKERGVDQHERRKTQRQSAILKSVKKKVRRQAGLFI
jgi:hypothetical protein